jgi:uroporphyrinogen-III synthase
MLMVCTREEERNGALIDELGREGMSALSLPLIRTISEPFDHFRRQLVVEALSDESTLVCFSSPNGVRYGMTALVPLLKPPECGIAVQGQATATAFEVLTGYSPLIISRGPTGEGLAATVRDYPRVFSRAILVGPWLPRRELASGLQAIGLSVTQIPVYRTEPREPAPTDIARYRAAGPCVVLFCSPSAVQSFIGANLISLNPEALYAAFGPTTAAALREAGMPVACEYNWVREREAKPSGDDGQSEVGIAGFLKTVAQFVKNLTK